MERGDTARGDSAPSFCPHCGFNLRADAEVERDGFTLSPSGTVLYEGQRLKLAKSHGRLLHSLASTSRTVHPEVLGVRCSGSEDPTGIVRVHVSRLRSHLRKAGVPDPIASVWGLGYRWEVAG